jgi:hypothetical protein
MNKVKMLPEEIQSRSIALLNIAQAISTFYHIESQNPDVKKEFDKVSLDLLKFVYVE